MKKLLLALVFGALLLSCQKSDLKPEKYIQFKIESSARFNAVYGVNNSIIDKWVYTTDFTSGSYSVSDNDTLFVSAWSDDPKQEYLFSVLYDGDVLMSNDSGIVLIF